MTAGPQGFCTLREGGGATLPLSPEAIAHVHWGPEQHSGGWSHRDGCCSRRSWQGRFPRLAKRASDTRTRRRN
eukprot:6465218-Amphidinium_carterae.1